jgi:hypothetical protein
MSVRMTTVPVVHTMTARAGIYARSASIWAACMHRMVQAMVRTANKALREKKRLMLLLSAFSSRF